MATITWRPGWPPIYGMMTADDGEPYDLTGATVYLSVHVGAACVVLFGTLADVAIGLVSFDPAPANLHPRAYRATAHAVWADGSTAALQPDFIILIEGGC